MSSSTTSPRAHALETWSIAPMPSHITSTRHSWTSQQSPLLLMSLPNECLTLLIQWVASQGVQDLFSLLCVNKRLFYLVVPLLYRDPFRLSARWVWKRSVYKGVIERQTKLIRTLLLCCTRTINIIKPIDTEATKIRSNFWTESSFGRALAGTYRNEKNVPVDATTTIAIPRAAAAQNPAGVSQWRSDTQIRRDTIASVPSSSSSSSRARRTASGSHLHSSVSTQHASNSVGSSIINGNRDTDDSRINYNSSSATSQQGTEHREGDRSRLKMLFQKLSVAYRGGQPLADASSKGPTYLTRIEKVPIIWDNDNHQPETRPIPGLGKPNSPKLKFPPELTKTIIRLANEPPPMTNYLAYVTHTDVRSWSAASNMTLVHEILGDARPSWRTRLQSFMKKTSRKIIGSQSLSDRQAGATAATEFMYDNRQDLDDFDEDDGEVFDLSLTFRNTSRYRRWRRRVKRNKNLWELRDVDFLELLLLFYTSAKMGSLSLGMNCSHWYHPSLNVLLPGIPERLSSLRRIVIDHADTIVHNAVPVPQLFIQRHQKAFPGKLREIQIRQSYHYSYDMSKSVLQTIKAMERLEVLDLSIWTGVFSGLDSICTDHLRKLLICHHMDVTRPEMFDELLKRCPVLEELSIVVPHSNLFAWALERRVDLAAQVAGAGAGAGSGAGAEAELMVTKPSSRSFPLSRGATEDRQPAHLPPLKNLTLFGHTPDVVSAFKDAVFAFQHTLESVQVSMYSDMGQPPDSHSHFEVSPPHFELPDEMPQALFFGTNILQDTPQMNANPSNPVLAGPQLTLDPYNVSPELSAPWHQEILTGINTNDDGSPGSGLSSASSCKSPPSYLTWSWPLPRLRTMTLRGPVVAFFDLQLLRFCPQLRDVALSYHCACLPRLVFPTTVLAGNGGATTSVPNRYPRIMVCDSLALEWGMTLQEERRGMVMV